MMNPSKVDYDLIIVGAGVCGTALAYVLAEFSNVGRMAIMEKNESMAASNSHPTMNSQTLHFGDIETNYDLERSKEVRDAAQMVRTYLERHDRGGNLHSRYGKMALAIGEDEVARLGRRYELYRDDFPRLEALDRDELAELEPKVVEGREEGVPLLALYTDEGYTVDFQALARSFFERADRAARLDAYLHCPVTQIEETREGYRLHTPAGVLTSRAIAVNAGPYSLDFARQLGCRGDNALLSVAGSFYFAHGLLRNKVYTLQIPELPFAAIHGDPEVDDRQKTRFGPTAKVLPMLERHRYRSVMGYFRTAGLRLSAIAAFFRILLKPVVLRFTLRNLLYDLPFLGRHLFARAARRIVPTLKASDIERAKGYGGIRPQIVDVDDKELDMGEQKIRKGRAVFNITPSPGASVCLKSALDDALYLSEVLPELEVDRDRVKEELTATGSPSRRPDDRNERRRDAYQKHRQG